MPKQMVEIDVPDGWDVDYAELEHGFSQSDGLVMIRGINLHLRKSWQWPSWLNGKWLFMVPSGEWYASESEPLLRCNQENWDIVRGGACSLSKRFFDFTPPPCTDWKTSLRKNPKS